ncbi:MULTISPECIES: nucleoside-diphosphate kinase [Methanocorpusculum]|jgi:nucleoside-diphosphate kinase|uniref:Nucleoside diphosphate kinase n=1 Tax=Methanocorpusculum parvum TaxID=2193 RepID=A0AAX0Q8W9_9EURY|nr:MULTISPECIES: nucleoside-diphosphate kinase [Methanocorpusculum]MDD2248422.1 nucleoside-diphosphate kinase [Methanocorpusculum sp.]MDD2802792.1 nucleoside-diphosphate kinase [Methanocorpusculum sp.]MDD3046852.1 nucleoside-diphosphate kinase [Methanocorpusculum sp.]MDD3912115.1 nucleoside-diphosphate kinase [Methanocorpusculum sp.]MDD4423252.1 nucleoside-diphosphate kinase [Methanocorpusculum parvum]
MERTFVMIKPDGVQRGLVGEILSRFENKGFKLVAGKFGVLAESIVDKHYEEHLAKPFYPGMKAYITSGPVFRFVLEGENVVATVRKMNGATNPTEANPGTIRGDYALSIGKNVIHAADSPESAAREIGIHFTPAELVSYTKIDESELYE